MRPTTRAAGRRYALAVSAVVAASFGAGFAGVAVTPTAVAAPAPRADPGDPVIPGPDQIAKAEAEAQVRKAAVGRIQASLDAADRQLRLLQAGAGRAVEMYDAAAAQSALAKKTADEAQRRLGVAEAAKQEADHQLGAFAAQSYRNGPDMAGLMTLMHVSTLRQFTDSEQAMRTMARLEASAIATARAAERAAEDWQDKASAASAKAADAARAAARARDVAQAAAENEQGEVARIGVQREALVAQMAQAQGIAVALERQREQGLQEQAARAEAARAEAARRTAALSQALSRQSGSAAKTTVVPPNGTGAVGTMLKYIYAQLGKPYVWGGEGPNVFDCSGLAMRGLEAAGWNFPHPAQWQYLAMHQVGYSDLRPGDLVFWAEDDSNPHTIYHEAIFIGNDRIIQAPKPGGVVEIQSLWINGPPSYYGRP